MNTVYFPGLAVAARRLHLDAVTEAELAECVLGLIDAGYGERRAVAMALRELVRRVGVEAE